MISTVIDEISSFLYDTVILLVSGCVSLVALSGVFSALTFFAVKQLKRFGYVGVFVVIFRCRVF